MKRYRMFAGVLMLSFLSVLICSTIFAQEEEMEYSYGTVAAVSSNQIKVVEYDYYEGVDIEVTYAVDSQTEFNNVGSLEDISEGDAVEIEYIIKGNKKLAKIIDVEATSPEDEYVPLGMEDEEAGYFQ